MILSRRDPMTRPEVHAPFALIVGKAVADDALEGMMRRMGLRPDAARAGGLPLQLTLGGLTVTIDRAAPDDFALADPGDVATSSLGTPLPADWRDAGGSWIVRSARGDGIAAAQFDTLFQMIVLLIDAFDADHIFWSPARLWTDARQFRGAIAEMQTSGMPPVLHLIAFRRRDGAADPHVATRGLAAFAGQELDAAVPPGWDMAAMVKRLARLALDIMLHGPVVQPQQTPGLQAGEWVALTPQGGARDGPAAVLVEFSFDR